MYCLTLNPNHLELIKKLDYNPVGLGEINFHGNEWFVDTQKTILLLKINTMVSILFITGFGKTIYLMLINGSVFASIENFGKKIRLNLMTVILTH